MKVSLLALVSTALLFPGMTANAGDTDSSKPMRPLSQCLRSDRMSDWKAIDDRRLLVKALGGRYFDIQLQHRCPDLLSSAYIGFRDGFQPTLMPDRPGVAALAQNPALNDGRICGDIGDAVITNAGSIDSTLPACDIASIRKVDATAWKAHQKDAS